MHRLGSSSQLARIFPTLTLLRYIRAGRLIAEKTMLGALGRLLLRGAVNVGICAVAALCVTIFLSWIAMHFQPSKQVAAETIAATYCKPSHCRPKTGVGHQFVAAKAQ
jgi:hypothetical protein